MLWSSKDSVQNLFILEITGNCIIQLRTSTKQWEDKMPDKMIYFKRADSDEERLICYNIRYEAYLPLDYIEETKGRIRKLRYDDIKETKAFLGFVEGRPVGTVSVTLDSALGLPVEQDFPDIVWRVREEYIKQNKIICEGHSIMILPEFQHRGRELSAGLARIAFRQAYLDNANYMCIGLVPEHVEIWRKWYGFDRISDFKTYETLNSITSCVVGADLDLLKQRTNLKIYDYLFTEEAQNIVNEDLRKAV